MPPRVADAVVFVPAKAKRAVEHFSFVRAGKPGGLVFAFGNHGICVVDANFRSGVDAVLSFPKFDQPGFVLIIEVDRQGVEDHPETGRQIVVKPGVASLFLGRIHCGRKETVVTVEIITEGGGQFIQKGALGAAVHGIDLADDLFAAALKENAAEKGDEQ